MPPSSGSGAVTRKPSAGPSSAVPLKSPVGDALYEWARTKEDSGYVFTQQELLDSGLIPQKSLTILLDAVKYLLGKRLFKAHDVKGQQGAGYELIEEAAAAK